MLRPELLRCLAVWAALSSVLAAAAPVQTEEDLVQADPNTAVKAKRSEEMIMFGNHQNNARVKKTDPSLPADPMLPADGGGGDPTEEDVIDKQARLAVATAPAEDKSQSSPDVADNIEDQPRDSHVIEEAPVLSEFPNSNEESEEDRTDGSTGKSEESELVNLNQINKQQEPEEDKTEDEEAEESSGEAEPGVDQYYFQPEEAQLPNDYYQYLDLGNEYYYPELGRRRRSAKLRLERSAPALTAEDMGTGMAGKETRVKRDLGLTEEDLRELLEEDALRGDLPYDEEEEGTYGYEEPEDDGDEATVQDIRDVLEQLEDSYGEQQPVEDYPAEEEEEQQVADYGDVAEDGYPVLDEADLEAARAKLALLRYMYAEEQAAEEEQEEEQEEEIPGYGEVEETWDDIGPDTYEASPSYEMINYRGKRGMFIPIKRQYLSFVPGNKRSFYPYSYGPDGRWGAFVPKMKEEKRGEEDMYERLYQLAQALRDRQDGEEEEWKKRK